MGEIARAMLDGVLCQWCGEDMGKGQGYPRICGGCQGTDYDEHGVPLITLGPCRVSGPPKKPCPICNKRLCGSQGVRDHMRDKHGDEARDE